MDDRRSLAVAVSMVHLLAGQEEHRITNTEVEARYAQFTSTPNTFQRYSCASCTFAISSYSLAWWLREIIAKVAPQWRKWPVLRRDPLVTLASVVAKGSVA
ncbi:hypothetical protein E2C01_053145 [Portunus trituberculatus]|uniref:Uncharacterized protein n=1 Tax=Portunus trituberculatus TaxID=210409 RepID=A0A5B7GFM9_PORTR|nr:hypothetical protein [Portunus trituberculatus]